MTQDIDDPSFEDDAPDDGLLDILSQSRDANQVSEQWRHLITLARKLEDQGQHAFAIVIAAASGEAATSFVLGKLLDAPPRETGKAVFELNKRRARKGKNVITWTLENGRILKAYIELTGENPEKEAWWTN